MVATKPKVVEAKYALPSFLELTHSSEVSHGLKKVCKKLRKKLLLYWCFQSILWSEKMLAHKIERLENLTRKKCQKDRQ